MSPVLSVDSLSVDYQTDGPPVEALTDVTLTVESREIVGVVGESGCGKSTLAAAVLRLLAPNATIREGSISLNDQRLFDLDERRLMALRGSDVSMIFQDPMASLNPTFTIGQQMVDVLRQHLGRGHGRREMLRTAIDALNDVELPDARTRVNDYPHQFSGGQRQRILIAMSLLLRPDLLVADEPTSALDVTLEAQILRLLLRLRDKYGTAMLYVSHDIKTVRQLCDRVVVMYAGRIVEEGPTMELLSDPLHPYTRALLRAVPALRGNRKRLISIAGRVPDLTNLASGCTFADRCQEKQPWMPEHEPSLISVRERRVRCHLYSNQNVDCEMGRSHSDDSRDGNDPPTSIRHLDSEGGATTESATESLVTASGVAVHFRRRGGFGTEAKGPVRAVDDVSIRIRRGEILGLVGESGSGKSTLGEALVALVRPSSGAVEFDGHDLGAMAKRELRDLRRRVQVIFQDPHSSLSPRLSVEQLLLEPYRIHKGIPAAERYSPRELLEMVGMAPEHLPKYPSQLSGGQARRIGIARAISFHPEFLVADEPTSGLDVSAAASVLNLMRDLRDRLNLTYLVITHNLSTLGYMADRIAVMYLGRIVEIGPSERVLRQPTHPYTRTLVAASDADAPLDRTADSGEIPSAQAPPAGCRFHPRCEYAGHLSSRKVPMLEEVDSSHLVACHYWRDLPELDL